MKYLAIKAISSLSRFRIAAPLFTLLLLGTTSFAGDDRDQHEKKPPRVPTGLQVSATNELDFHVTGVGVQIYVWTQSPTDPTQFSWVFKAPHAVLLHRDDIVGIHFAGPSWQGNDGSKVVAARVSSATVDPDAIPWLLLQATSTSGIGIFANTTYIQRIKTEGGVAPTTPGSFVGQEALVPYVAEYYFYRAR